MTGDFAKNQSKGMLIVEDDSAISELIESHLGNKYNIISASNSDDGLRLLKNNLNCIEYIIVDIWLPENVGENAKAYLGIQFARLANSLCPDAKILGMSQFIEAETGLRHSGLFFGFVEKSYLISNPVESLRRALEKGGVIESKRKTSDYSATKTEVKKREIPWLIVSLIAGLSAGLLVLLMSVIDGIARTGLLSGLVVFIIVLLRDPKKRFQHLLSSFSGIWVAISFLPAINFQVNSELFNVDFATLGKEGIFHFVSGGIFICLCFFAFFERQMNMKNQNYTSSKGKEIP